MKTLREAKIKVATKFLDGFLETIAKNRQIYKMTGEVSPKLQADIIMAPMLLVEALENEEILHAEYCHEASLENAYKR